MKQTAREVILGLLRPDVWMLLHDLINAARMRRGVSKGAVLTELVRLRREGMVEHQGLRGAFEYRLKSEEHP